MKSTGRVNSFDKLENKPQKPFLTDLKKDLKSIDKCFTKKEANEIKKLLINEILNSI